MTSVTASYEDTLRTLRTGKGDSSPLGNLRRYMTWGRNNDELPFATSKASGGGTGESPMLSWPPWASSSLNPPPFYDTFGLSTMQRYAAFGMCILGAVLLLFLAFVHLVPGILRPSKFVVPYCLSNVLLFVSFGFIHGFYSYGKHLFSADRWPFSVAFIGTTFATLYVSMAMKMYALTMPMAIIQLIATGAYVVSYLPGGASGISMIGSLATSSIRSRISGF